MGRQSASLDPDDMDFDEVVNEFGGSALKMSRGVEANSSAKKQGGGAVEDIASNSFDLDSSDDLNKFINRYETMLDGDRDSSKVAPRKARDSQKKL